MRFITRSIVLISAVSIFSGCSDSGSSKSNSSLVNVEGWVGAQGFNNAQVVVNQIAESGQVSVSSADTYLGLRESTDGNGKFTATVAPDEAIMFIARGQVANVDKDLNNLATTRQCQVASGCFVAGTNYAFSSYYPATTGFEWRSVVYTQEKGSQNNVNPITTLASRFAYTYDVLTTYKANTVRENDTFTPYDIVLANSQVANLFGLTDIIGRTPANLTKLNNFTNQEQIRYGALIAAFQQLSLASTDADFMTEVVAQFVQDKGQLFRQDSAGNARQLALYELYTAAHENLTALLSKVTNTEAKSAVNAVIAKLKTDATPAEGEATTAITDAKPDDLSALLSATELSEISVGLQKTKLFIDSLLDYQNYFWQAGYKSEIDEYAALLKTVGDKNKDNLNALVAEFALIQDYYVNIQNDAITCNATTCTAAAGTDLATLETRYPTRSYNSNTKVLTLSGTGGVLTVSQKIADLNIYDSITEPSSSQAIDVFITGTMTLGDVVLNLEHKLTTAGSIDVPSSMRIYYTQKVSSIAAASNAGLLPSGYEVIWGDFELSDGNVQLDPAGTEASEIELEGSFRIFYRGVQNSNEPELRFNIEELVLTSTISDNVDDDAGSDSETTTVFITASASNASDYYPAKKFASFNGFFESNESLAASEIQSLLNFTLGTEVVQVGSRKINVETADFINKEGDDIRYRFYPTERVTDDFDTDGDGDYKEKVDMHYLEECELDEINNTVVKCGSRTQVFATRDRQNTLNELWKLGVIQNITVPGRGSYFVEFPATKNAQGCFELDALPLDSTIDGILTESMVLGLDTVRLYTEINLKNSDNVSLPKTLFDMTVVAPTKDRYQVNASLSHNYSSSFTDSSGLILGSGSSASVVAVSYDTSSDFKDMGNISIAKGGVQISLGGVDFTEDQDITAFLTQTYDSSAVHYKMLEGADGQPERCVTANKGNFNKSTATPEEKVFYLNYRDVLYGTAREENGVWVIRYLDGSWLIPGTEETGSDIEE